MGKSPPPQSTDISKFLRSCESFGQLNLSPLKVTEMESISVFAPTEMLLIVETRDDAATVCEASHVFPSSNAYLAPHSRSNRITS